MYRYVFIITWLIASEVTRSIDSPRGFKFNNTLSVLCSYIWQIIKIDIKTVLFCESFIRWKNIKWLNSVHILTDRIEIESSIWFTITISFKLQKFCYDERFSLRFDHVSIDMRTTYMHISVKYCFKIRYSLILL